MAARTARPRRLQRDLMGPDPMETELSPTSAHLPGVDRLVSMHQRHVASKHAPYRLLPGFTGLLAACHFRDLPRCSIGQTQAAAFDDLQQPTDLGLVDLPLPQTIRRQWQQLANDQFGYPYLADLRPVDLRIDAGTNTGDEVFLGRLERHLSPDRTILACQGTHDAGEEGSVGYRVDDRRPRWEYAVLNTQMG